MCENNYPPKDCLEFDSRVQKILGNEMTGTVVEKIWSRTNLGQPFVFVITRVVWFAVRWIVDEEYSQFPILYRQNVRRNQIFEREEFLTIKDAKQYIGKMIEQISKNDFGKHLKYRLRKVPDNFLENPDKYLKPGAHIQRYLKGGLANIIGVGSHEGIYLGNGQVAHMSVEGGFSKGRKNQARPIIEEIKAFLIDSNQELRVVDHCFRRRDPETIVEAAKEWVKKSSTSEGFYDDPQTDEDSWKPYKLFWNNCQHFATSCAIGEHWMTEYEHFAEDFSVAGATGLAILGAAVTFLMKRK